MPTPPASTPQPPPAAPDVSPPMVRIEVAPRPGEADPAGEAAFAAARRGFPGVEAVRSARVYLIQAPLSEARARRVAHELLADPVSQRARLGAGEAGEAATLEVHYLPGVMDPVAGSTADAIAQMLPETGRETIRVRTAMRYDLAFAAGAARPDDDRLTAFAYAALANPVVQAVHTQPFTPADFARGRAYDFKLTRVALLGLDDAGLEKLSREGHLFLSLAEMRAIQAYFRGLPGEAGETSGGGGETSGGGREPTDIELETLAQTWSEHCVHKTLKSTIHYRPAATTAPGSPPPGSAIPGSSPAAGSDPQHDPAADVVVETDPIFDGKPNHEEHPDGSVTIHNLLKSTVAAATFELMAEDPAIQDWCVSVFEDNAGIVKLDDDTGICIKVETHNHPSAIEPYGGAATGIGGCIRDIIAAGLGAAPIANTDTFCVANPQTGERSDGHDSGIGVRGLGFGKNHNAHAHAHAPEPDTRYPKPDTRSADLPTGVIPPRRTLTRVVDGVRDYGNRMGIPTINGAVYFHDDYLGNPLVFAGCVGKIPLDKCFGEAGPEDRIIALGGATGRDGIHGATFSSAELTDTHADEFAHAVQIGNPITEKKLLDVILQARDHEAGTLFSAITDCGAGGFSSAIGEMGEKVGADVHLDRAPLKYAGLSYTEIWISEAQERLVLSVPPENAHALRELCDAEDVTYCDLGAFGCTDDAGAPLLVLNYHEHEVGRLSMRFLHEGIPTPVREATWPPPPEGAMADGGWKMADGQKKQADTPPHANSSHHPSSIRHQPSRELGLADTLHALLAHPNIASKHWIIRQYDHEVQGGSVVKPLVGPEQDGPSDAAVVRPKLDSPKGVALSVGMAPHLAEKTPGGDSYVAALAAIDEAVRNAVCVGAHPDRIAILDNFCWPSCDNPAHLGSLVRAAEACYDGAMAYRTPFVSGKDSLSNQFTTDDGRVITIPPTLLISALGIVDDVTACRTMDAKAPGNALLIVGRATPRLGGSHYAMLGGADGDAAPIPRVDLAQGPANARAAAALIRDGLVASAHDCSEGGLLVAAAEMAFAGRVGLDLDLAALPAEEGMTTAAACFAETPSRYLLEVAPDRLDAVIRRLRDTAAPFAQVGVFADHDRLTLRAPARGRGLDQPLDALRESWRRPLDW